MTTTAPASENQTFTITEEISVRASLEQTFASLVAQMGRLNENPEGAPLPMILEPHPGGRWYRDLGGDNGHLWGFVQSIKRPALLEIWGPLFMSTAATSNLLYRLTETPEGTLIKFTHTLWDRSPTSIGRGSRRDGPRSTRAFARPLNPPRRLGESDEDHRRTARRARTGSCNDAPCARADTASAPVVELVNAREQNI